MKPYVVTTILASAVMWLPPAVLSASAAETVSAVLGRIASCLKIDTAAIRGNCLNIDAPVKHVDKTLRLRTNSHGDISHIGYRIFNDEIVAAYPDNRVFDFVERYALELRLKTDSRVKTAQERLALDEVSITQGCLEMLYNVTEETPLIVDYVPRRMYNFTWTIDGDKKLSMMFKADCHLITGTNAIELEQRFLHDVVRCSRVTVDEAMQQWTNARITTSEDKRIMDTGTYLSEAINDKLYQYMHDDRWSLVRSSESAVRSICNIMLTGGCEMATDLPLQLVVDKYGYKTDTLHITLGQLGKYLVDDHCHIYVGVKEADAENLHGTLFVVNEAMGYNHVIPFVCPFTIADGGVETIKARIYTYVPIQNVTEKFFDHVIYDKYE